VITFALRGQVKVLHVQSLATRRGPAPEARLLYAEIDETVEPCAPGQMTAYRGG
jgi:ribosomal 50S subunit-recycling heat shock protein